MTNELATTAPSVLAEQMQFAQSVASASMLPAAYRGKPADVLLAVGLGQSMGLSPAESLYRIDVIQGTPTASAELIAANVRKAGHKLRVEVDEQRMTVTATIIRADDPDFPHVVTRDMAWAKRMGLEGKDNYKKQPVTMLQWRAITGVARLACPEALYGVAYTADEIRDGMPGTPGAPTATAPRSYAAPVETGEAISDEQVADLETLMDRKGIDGAARLAGTRHIVGRDIESLEELTAAEYAQVVDALAAREDVAGEDA